MRRLPYIPPIRPSWVLSGLGSSFGITNAVEYCKLCRDRSVAPGGDLVTLAARNANAAVCPNADQKRSIPTSDRITIKKFLEWYFVTLLLI